MPHWLHTFLRILVPGIVVLVECFLLYVFGFQALPNQSEIWSFMATDWGKWTGFSVLAVVLGFIYYVLGITHAIDDRTLGGMTDVRDNIVQRLTETFRSDLALSGKPDQLQWRTIRRVFFGLVDEIPSLKTSVNLALLSGLAFYSFIDLATVSAVVLFIAAELLASGLGSTHLRWYVLALEVTIAVSIVCARAAIRTHKNRSNLQLDAILSDHFSELRDRLNNSVTS